MYKEVGLMSRNIVQCGLSLLKHIYTYICIVVIFFIFDTRIYSELPLIIESGCKREQTLCF